MRKEKVHRKRNPESLRTHDRIFKPAVNQSSANRQEETMHGYWGDGESRTLLGADRGKEANTGTGEDQPL